MKALVKYSGLANQSLSEVIDTIFQVERIRFGDLKVSDLFLTGSLMDLKLSDFQKPDSFGRGIYVFFDEYGIPVYVGKADNFLNRFLSHRSTLSRDGWGWNALLQATYRHKINAGEPLTDEKLQQALLKAEGFSIVRVLFDHPKAIKKLAKLEKILAKGINNRSGTLWNGRIGKVSEHFTQEKLMKLMDLPEHSDRIQ